MREDRVANRESWHKLSSLPQAAHVLSMVLGCAFLVATFAISAESQTSFRRGRDCIKRVLFLGNSYTIPDAAWELFPAILTAELGSGWEAAAGGDADPYCIVLRGPQAVFFLKSTRVTTRDGVARRLVLEVEEIA